MKKWIGFPKVEGDASRQAHADMPEGTYEVLVSFGTEGYQFTIKHAEAIAEPVILTIPADGRVIFRCVDQEGEPIKHTPILLTTAAGPARATTDGDGMVRASIARTLSRARGTEPRARSAGFAARHGCKPGPPGRRRYGAPVSHPSRRLAAHA